MIHRTALVNRLRSGRPPIVVVTAPAGYGKTTTLAQWDLRDTRPFAWVRLLPEDDHPVALLRSLVESLSRIAPVDDEIALRLTTRPLRPDTVARRLGRWLLARTEAFVIVLDNAGYIRSEASQDVLVTLAEHLPQNVHLVLSSRRQTTLPLARRRARGVIIELDEHDLRFTDREAAKLFAGFDVEVNAVDAARINERVEGWPTGLMFAAMALERRRGHPARSVTSFDGAHHFVAEFFDVEVLANLDPADVDFVTQASLLDRMSGPSCDAILGVHGSSARLERLAHEGAFVVPLDREHHSFRFQRCFRTAVRSRLEQHEPERFLALSRRAAEWAEQDGDIVAAIQYLRGIGDREGAARLLGAAGPAVYGGELLTPLEPSLVELADDSLLAEHPSAAVIGSLAHALLGHPAAALRWAAAAEAGRLDGAPSDGKESTDAMLHVLDAALCYDGAGRMLEDAEAAFGAIPSGSPLSAFSLLLQGVAHVLRGDPAAAESALTDAVARATGGRAPLVLATATAELSLLRSEQGEWQRAEELALDARDLVERLDEKNAAAALVYAASARSALRHSNWVRVREDIERVHRLLPRCTEVLPWLSGQARVELAHTHLALNDLPAVRELLAEIDVLMLARPHLGGLRAAAAKLREEVERLSNETPGSSTSLTAAELRLLPLLATHLTFRQIGEHLFVSRNTIKTQAISVYRKLGVSSRSEAIERACDLGYLSLN